MLATRSLPSGQAEAKQLLHAENLPSISARETRENSQESYILVSLGVFNISGAGRKTSAIPGWHRVKQHPAEPRKT